MISRRDDGSAGDADYGLIGKGYAQYRRPDPRIAAMIGRELASARTVLNVGAGAGSYEPVDRWVTAVEPSASMRAQRPSYLPVAIDAVAEHLPFEENSFDASMATFTVHQWPNLKAGLTEPSDRDYRSGIRRPYRDHPCSDPVGLYRRLRGSLLRPTGMLARPRRPPGMLRLEFRRAIGGGPFCERARSRSRKR